MWKLLIHDDCDFLHLKLFFAVGPMSFWWQFHGRDSARGAQLHGVWIQHRWQAARRLQEKPALSPPHAGGQEISGKLELSQTRYETPHREGNGGTLFLETEFEPRFIGPERVGAGGGHLGGPVRPHGRLYPEGVHLQCHISPEVVALGHLHPFQRTKSNASLSHFCPRWQVCPLSVCKQ